MSFLSGMSETEDDSQEDEEEWMPEAKAPPAKRQARKPKEPTKKPAAKAKTAAAPKPRKPAAKRTSKTSIPVTEESGITSENKDSDASTFQEITVKQERKSISVEQTIKKEKPKKRKMATETSKAKPIKVKAERKSLSVDEFPSTSSKDTNLNLKNERRSTEEEEPPDDFTFGPPTKKLKTSDAAGKPVKYKSSSSGHEGTEMNWDIVEVLAERTNVEPWVCANIIKLFQDENTIPFIARYRKELINNLDADTLREVQQSLEELRSVARKAHSLMEKLRKEGKLNPGLHNEMLNCRTLDEIEHVYAPFKTGSKGTKAQRARQLGLEPAAKALIETPQQLNLHMFIKEDTEGLSILREIEVGVQHILADMIAKDKDTLDSIRNL
ncbi:unnamed protein product, partial [Staurois parvus]